MAIKTIFLDRDGVINKDVHYLNKIENFEFIEGVFDACIYFHSLNYKIIIVTNQSGITRGFLSEQDYQKINKWMLNQFSKRDISILDTFHCPHGPNANCNCRKPKTLLVNNLVNKYNLVLKKSVFIGDSDADRNLAKNLGISFLGIQSKNGKKNILKHLKLL